MDAAILNNELEKIVMQAAKNVTEAINNNHYFYDKDGDIFIGNTHISPAGKRGFYWLEQYIKNNSDCVTASIVCDDFGNLVIRTTTSSYFE